MFQLDFLFTILSRHTYYPDSSTIAKGWGCQATVPKDCSLLYCTCRGGIFFFLLKSLFNIFSSEHLKKINQTFNQDYIQILCIRITNLWHRQNCRDGWYHLIQSCITWQFPVLQKRSNYQLSVVFGIPAMIVISQRDLFFWPNIFKHWG